MKSKMKSSLSIETLRVETFAPQEQEVTAVAQLSFNDSHCPSRIDSTCPCCDTRPDLC